MNPNGANPLPEPYQHDAHGNMVRMPHLGGGLPGPNMHWDYKDQLRQTDLGGGGTAFYVYDASGQRVRKVWEKAPGLTEERIYLGGFEIFRKHGGPIGANTATLERETLHVMDDKQRIALVETRTLDTAGNDQAPRQLIRYQFGNHLGSASLELDEQAQIISYEEYAPYGSSTYQAVRSQTETAKRYRYTGKERDEETGFTYYGGRYSASWLGRWIAFDPKMLVDRRLLLRSSGGEESGTAGPPEDEESGEPKTTQEASSDSTPGTKDETTGKHTTLGELNGYVFTVDNPIALQDPDGWTPVPIGHVYVVRGTLGGEAVTYVGSTAQDLLARVGGRHRWNALITAEGTTVTTYQVTAELNVAASARGTLLSARNEALRAAEQRILTRVSRGEAVTLNEIRAATPENATTWRARHSVSIGRGRLTLRGGVRVGAFAGFALLDLFNMWREERLSRYAYAPYILEDAGGQFTLSEERAHWFAHHYRWKVYQSGPLAGQRVEVDEVEFDFWRREGELLWGTTDFWGDFVPGLLRPRLPVVERPSSSPYGEVL